MTQTNRLSLRFVFIALVALGLLVPLLFVSGVADERQGYYRQVVTDIGQSWGREQSIVGPFLVVPATDAVAHMDDNGRPRQQLVEVTHVVLPDRLAVDANIQHDFRQRGIYSVPVYTAVVTIQGALGEIARDEIDSAHRQVHWEQAKLVMGITDTRAIRRASGTLAGQQLDLQPGAGVKWLAAGVHANMNLSSTSKATPDSAYNFEFSLELAGTDRYAVAPIGNQSELTLTSTWPHPSFGGNFLPQERKIDDSGFSAAWTVSALARGVPKHFVFEHERSTLQELSASVGLYEPVTSYTNADRGIKYGILFIGLTFLTAVCFELLSGLRFHIIQYGVVGLALVMFYLTLLSLSEQMTFVSSYAIATGVILLLLGGYAFSITGSLRIATTFVGVEAALYWVLYVLLQLEDLALLTGTGVLLVGLAALMLATKGLHRDTAVPDAPAS